MSGNPKVCAKCGEIMPGLSGETIILQGGVETAPIKKKIWSSAQVGESRTIRAFVNKTVHTIRLPSDEEIVLGRSDEDVDVDPDVDLAAYKAVANGVSRRHAALRLNEDMVQLKDLDSTNGTFLNGHQLGANEWRIVRDGDKLELGNLMLTLYFDTD
jgi:pSer/pThr/pTyr-binding forkhead associated (FHA) protein